MQENLCTLNLILYLTQKDQDTGLWGEGQGREDVRETKNGGDEIVLKKRCSYSRVIDYNTIRIASREKKKSPSPLLL